MLASEAGALDIAPERVVTKGRVKPGRMFLVDTVRGRVIEDEEIKRDLAARRPYRAWVTANRVGLDELPEPISIAQPDAETLLQQQALDMRLRPSRTVLTLVGTGLVLLWTRLLLDVWQLDLLTSSPACFSSTLHRD